MTQIVGNQHVNDRKLLHFLNPSQVSFDSAVHVFTHDYENVPSFMDKIFPWKYYDTN